MEKRKSVFGRRRSRRSIGTILLPGLCETVPDTLEPHKRLKMLIEYAFKQTFSVVEREFGLLGNLDPLTQNELWKKIESVLEEQKLCESAVDKKQEEENPIMIDEIEEYNRYTERYEEENRKWDDLELQYRKALESAVNSNTVQFNKSLDLSKYQHNYSGVLEDMNSLAKDVNFEVNGLAQIVHILKSSLEMGNVLISELNFKAKKFLDEQSHQTPRTIIRKVFSSDAINETEKP